MEKKQNTKIVLKIKIKVNAKYDINKQNRKNTTYSREMYRVSLATMFIECDVFGDDFR